MPFNCGCRWLILLAAHSLDFVLLLILVHYKHVCPVSEFSICSFVFFWFSWRFKPWNWSLLIRSVILLPADYFQLHSLRFFEFESDYNFYILDILMNPAKWCQYCSNIFTGFGCAHRNKIQNRQYHPKQNQSIYQDQPFTHFIKTVHTLPYHTGNACCCLMPRLQ